MGGHWSRERDPLPPEWKRVAPCAGADVQPPEIHAHKSDRQRTRASPGDPQTQATKGLTGQAAQGLKAQRLTSAFEPHGQEARRHQVAVKRALVPR